MPTFYWVGNGCPKTGTSSTSHLWGTSEYHWNTPSNWVVAHSVHRIPMPGSMTGGAGFFPPSMTGDFGGGTGNGGAGATGGGGPITTDSFDVFVEVYGTPNRAPGPGDKVYVGHYPWMIHEAMEGTRKLYPHQTSKIDQINHRQGFIVRNNDTMFDGMAWSSVNSPPLYLGVSAPGIARTSTDKAQAVLAVRLDPKTRTLLVPRGVVGTSNTPVYGDFYATTEQSVGYNTDFSVWKQWTSKLATSADGSFIIRETQDFNQGLWYMLFLKNQYRNGFLSNFYSTNETNVSNVKFQPLPDRAATPLLWGGCVSATGATTEAVLQGGTGNVYWANSGASGNDVWGATGQSLHEMNVVLYGDMPTQFWADQDSVGDDETESQYYGYIDIYPFKSVGDGLFGEEYATVKSNLLLSGSVTGSFLGYSCTGAATGQREVNYQRILNGGLTAEGKKAENLFIKTQNAYIYSPNEWNKYAGQNQAGTMILNGSISAKAPAYSRAKENYWKRQGILQSHNWANSWLGVPDTNNPTALQNRVSKYVQLRFADYTLYPSGTTGPGATGPEWYYGTKVMVNLPYGQFNMPYGKIQKVVLGTERSGMGGSSLPGGLRENGFTRDIVNFLGTTVAPTRTNYYDLGLEKIGNSSISQFSINTVWPNKALHFIGGQTSDGYDSRVNETTIYGASTTFQPRANIGSVKAYIGRGDLVEFMSKSLTSPASPNGWPLGMPAQYAGETNILHGHPQVASNAYGDVMGVYMHGSSITGTNYYRPVVTAKSTSKTTDANMVPAKTAMITSALHSQIGDMVLENTDYTLFEPSKVSVSDESEYGQKTIDRLFAKESATIDISQDTGGYLHIGRILSAGSTGGTGSVYGGVLFESDSNCILKPAAGHRFWVSNVDGKITDTRQPNLLLSYVVSNPDIGNAELPSSLDNSGAVAATNTQSPYSPSSGFISTVEGKDGRKTMLGLEQQGDINGEIGVA